MKTKQLTSLVKQTDNQVGGRKYLFTVTEAAKFIGVSGDTLRNWEEKGKVIPKRTAGGARRYTLSQLNTLLSPAQQVKTAPVARVPKPSAEPKVQPQPAQVIEPVSITPIPTEPVFTKPATNPVKRPVVASKNTQPLPKAPAPLAKQYSYTISEATRFLGVSVDTLRNWEQKGKIQPFRTAGGARRYSLEQLRAVVNSRQPQLLSTIKETSVSSSQSSDSLNTERSGRPVLTSEYSYLTPPGQVPHLAQTKVLLEPDDPTTLNYSSPASDNPTYTSNAKTLSLLNSLHRGIASVGVASVLVASLLVASYLKYPGATTQLFKSAAYDTLSMLDPESFQELSIEETVQPETLAYTITPNQNISGDVLAANDVAHFLEINSSTTIGGDLTTDGSALVGLDLDVTGETTIGGGLTVSGATILEDTLDVSAQTTLTDLIASGQVQITGNAADTLLIQPSADPDATTKLFTLKNAAGLEKFSLTANGDIALTGTGTIGGALTVSGASTLQAVSATTLTTSDLATLASLKVTGTSTLSGAVTAESTLKVTGATTLSSSLAVSGASTLGSTLAVTGATTMSSTLAVTGAATFASTINTNTFTTTALTFSGDSPVISSANNQFSLVGGVGIGFTNSTTPTFPSLGLAVFGNVGIGTTSPTAKLDVIGDANITGSLTIGAGSILQLADGTYSSPSLTFTNDTDTGLYRTGTNSLSLVTAGSSSQTLTLDSSGNVGIGTTSPNAKLAVIGNALIGSSYNGYSPPTNGLLVQGNVGLGTSSAEGAIDVNGTSFFRGNLSLTTGQMLINDGSSSLPAYSFLNSPTSGLYSPSLNALSLITNGSATSGLTITSSGNVGIGMTYPGSKLAVSGGASIGSDYASLTAPTNGLFVQGNVGIGTTASSMATLSLGGSQIIGSTWVSTQTAPSNGLLVQGNVGIGATFTNTYALSVGGNVGVVGHVLPVGSNRNLGSTGQRWDTLYVTTVDATSIAGTVTGGSTSASDWTINSDNASADTETMSLAFERGTETPNAVLRWDVNSKLFNLNSGVVIGSTPQDSQISNSPYGVHFSSIPFDIVTEGSEHLSLISGGNVGIGTSNPYAQLAIKGDGVSTGLSFLTTDSVGTQRFAITDAGNVGIGTTTPGSPFEIETSSGSSAITIDRLASTNAGRIGFNTGSTAEWGLGLQGSTTRFGIFENNSTSTERFTIIDGGNIGVGTVSPTNLFHISGGNVGIGVTSAVSTLAVNGNSTIGWGLTGVSGPASGLAVSGNVGIGTTTADYNLSVIGTANFTSNVSIGGTLAVTGTSAFTGASTFTGQILASDGTAALPGYAFSGDTDTGIYRSSANNLTFTTEGVARGAFDANGNFGIGTTSPSYPLDVVGTIRSQPTSGSGLIYLKRYADNNVYSISGGTASDTTSMILSVVGSTADIKLQTTYGTVLTADQSGNVGIGASNPGSNFQVRGNGVFGFGAGSIAGPSNGLGVLGNVGIGTTTADYNLSVVGTTNITGALTLGGSFTPTGQILASDGTAALPGYAFSGDTDTGLWRNGANMISLTTAGSPQVAGSSINGLSINSSGNIGIGTTDQGQNLEIRGGNPGIRLRHNNFNYWDITSAWNFTNADLLFSMAGSEKARFNANGQLCLGFTGAQGCTASNSLVTVGNVGIGTTSTLARLDVRGSGTSTALNFLTRSNNNSAFGLAVLDNGNVGIGTSGPSEKLTIHTGTNENLGFRSFVTGSSGVAISAYNDAVSANVPFEIRGNPVYLTGGNVGVGLASPLALLHVGSGGTPTIASTGDAYIQNDLEVDGVLNVAGASTYAGQILLSDGSASAPGLAFSSDTNSGLWRSTADYIHLTVAGDSDTGIAINSSGNVGIGTSVPATKLEVNGDIRVGNSGQVQFPGSAGALSSIRAVGTSDLTFRINGTDRAIIDASGNLGLGTASPVANIHLVGDAASTAVNLLTQASTGAFGLAVLDNGNVGIGTTGPAATLNVLDTTEQLRLSYDTSNYLSTTISSAGTVTQNAVGTAGSTAFLMQDPVSIGSNAAVPGSTSNNQLSILAYGLSGTSSGEVFLIDARKTSGTTGTLNLASLNFTNNTGAGTLTQYRGLLVNEPLATVAITSTSGVVIENMAASTNNTNLLIGTDTQATGNFSIYNSSTYNNYFAGNVGIGTTGPSEKLTISGGASSSTLGVYGNSNTDSEIYLTEGGNAAGAMLRYDGGDNRLYILTSSGTTWTGGEKFTLDRDSGNVGIGTTSPTNLLHISGTTTPAIQLSNPGTTNWSMGLNTSSTERLVFGSSATVGTNPVLILNRAAEGGNVGIGATTPSYKLDVWGDGRFTSNLTVGGTLAVTGTSTFTGQILASDGTAALPGYAFSGDTNSGLWRSASDVIHLTTGGTNTSGIAINASGNVGIGTSVPGALFHIQSSSANPAQIITSSVTNSSLLIGNSSTGVAQLILDASNGDAVGSDYLTIRQNNDLTADIFTNTSAGILSLGSKGTTGTLNIDAGNVGLGTISPVADFHLVGDAASTAVNLLTQASDGTFGLSVLDNGNVGIGTTSPDTANKLHVKGSILAENGASTTGTIRNEGFKLWTDEAFGMDLIYNGSWRTALYTRSTDSDIAFGAYAANATGQNTFLEHMMIDGTSGNVGIGTTSPESQLTLADASASPTLIITPLTSTTADSIIELHGQAAITSEGFRITYDNDIGDTYFDNIFNGTDTDPAIRFRTETGATPINALTILHNGNIGIGTTTPLSKLHLVSEEIGDGANNGLRIDNYNNAKSYSLRTGITGLENTSLVIYDETAGANRIVVATGGNIGIADSTPDYLLDVAGTFNADSAATFGSTITSTGQILASNGTAALPGYSFSGDTNSGLWRSAADTIHLTTGGTYNQGLVVNSSGNVGIGTSLPENKLHVFSSSGQGVIKIGGSASEGRGILTYDHTGNYLDLVSYKSGYGNVVVSNGNVGIGFTSPLGKLYVADGGASGTNYGIYVANQTSGTSDYGIYLEGGDNYAIYSPSSDDVFFGGDIAVTNGNNNFIGVSLGEGLRFDGTGTYNALNSDVGLGIVIDSDATSTTGKFFIGKDNADPDSATQLFVVQEDGNVGIGTASPVAKLHLTGTGTTTGVNFLSTGAGGGGGLVGILDNGNVGIGTTSPATALDIAAGDITLENDEVIDNTTDGDILFKDSVDATDYLRIDLNTNSYPEIHGYVGGATTLVEFPTGLYVSGSTFYAANQLMARGGIRNDTDEDTNYESQQGLGFNLDYDNDDADTEYFVWTKNGTGFGGGTQLMRLTETGNLGIGLSAPLARLDVQGTGASTALNLFTRGSDGTQGLAVLDNGNVGIGTTGPNFELDIRASNTYADLELDGTTGGQIIFSDDGSNEWSIYGGPNLSFYDYGGTPGDRMTIQTSSGNVGIGIASPLALLHVGTGGTPTIASTGDGYFQNDLEVDGVLNVAGAVTFGSSITPTGQFLASDGTAALPGYAFSGDINSGLWRSAADQIHLTTAGSPTSGLTVTSAGNVGIGHSIPQSKLYVQGDIGLYGSNVIGSGSGYNCSTCASSGTIAVYDGVTTGGMILTSNYTGATGGIYFKTGGTTTRMRIDQAGNVGIGFTSPTNLLQLSTDTAGLGYSLIDNVSARTIATLHRGSSSNDPGVLALYNAGSQTVSINGESSALSYINNSGNFGIGTATPIQTFQVNSTTSSFVVKSDGNVGIGSTTPFAKVDIRGGNVYLDGAAGTILLTNGPGNTGQTTNLGIGYVGSGFSQDFSIRANGQDRVYIQASTGNVGIGTAVTGAPLGVDGNSNTAGIRIYGADATAEMADMFVDATGALVLSTIPGTESASYIDFRPEDDNYGLVLRDSDGSDTTEFANFYLADTTTVDYLNIVVNAATTTTGLVVADGGNIGIGWTSPSAKLQVSGDVFAGRPGVASELRVYSSNASGTGSYGTITSSASSLGRLVITGGGGSASTGNELQLSANTFPGLHNTYSLGTSSLAWTDLHVGTGGANVAGNVGIGTSAPAQKLDVLGGNGWATIGATTATRLYLGGSTGADPGNVPHVTTNGGAVYVHPTSTDWVALAYTRGLGAIVGGGGGTGNLRVVGGSLSVSASGITGTVPLHLLGDSTSTGVALLTQNSTQTNFGLAVLDNGNVGIGTSGPSTLLHITSTTSDAAVMKISGNGSGANGAAASLQFYDASADHNMTIRMMDQSNTKRLIFGQGTFGSNTSDWLTILGDTGNVGIGTTGPTALFNIYESDESTTLTSFTQALTNSGINITTNYTASAFTPGLFWSTSDNNATKPKAGIFLKEDGSGTDLYFGTSNDYSIGITNTAMVIDQTGNVGIGTTGPLALLHVGTGGTPGVASTGDAYIQNDLEVDGVLNVGGAVTYSGQALISDGSASAPGLAFSSDTNSGLWRSTTDWIHLTTGGSASNGIGINASGNVGVGISAPNAKLHVYGLLAVDSASSATGGQELRFSNISGGRYATFGSQYSSAAPFMAYNTYQTNAGESSGSDSWTQNSSSIRSNLIESNNTFPFAIYTTGTSKTAGTKSAYWGTASLVMNTSGNIGIGTTGPASILDIDTASNSLGLRLRGLAETTEIADIYVGASGYLKLTTLNTGGSAAYIELDAEDDQYGLIIRDSSTGSSVFSNIYHTDDASVDYLTFQVNAVTSTTPPLSIDDDDQVGMGTVTPDYRLELMDITNTPALALSDDDVAHGVTTLSQTDTFLHFTSLSTTVGGGLITGLADATGTALQMKGIQNSDPTDGTPALSLIGAKANGTGVQDLGSLETVLQIANNDNTATFTVLGNGNIGIGHTSPGGVLDVFSGATRLAKISSAGRLDLPVSGASAGVGIGSSADLNGVVLSDSATTAERTGTARRAYTATLTPEFEGAAMTAAVGVGNSGNMTSDFCSFAIGINATAATGCPTSGDIHNFYQWVSTEAATNYYDIWVRWQVPSDFSDWDTINHASDYIEAYGFRTSTSDSVAFNVYDTSNTIRVTDAEAGTSSAIWNQATIMSTTTGTWTPGSYVTFRIRMKSTTTANYARIGEINLHYLSKFK